MLISRLPLIKLSFCIAVILTGCQTQQIAVDYPDAETNTDNKQATHTRSFQALPGFASIDGDDFYVRLVSDFEAKGQNVIKQQCDNLSSSFKKNNLSSALIFKVQNTRLKFSNEVPGYSYQTTAGSCNYTFDAKKLYLTPWLRLDVGKDTSVDYSLYAYSSSDVDTAKVVNNVTTASSLLAFTGVGMGVAVLGQVAGQWFNANPQNQTTSVTSPNVSQSTESHTMPPFVSYANTTGMLKDTVFKINVVAEGGLSLLGTEAKPFGELKLYPELTPSLFLKMKANGLPDAHDLSWAEINATPVKSASGDINLQQLIEQSNHPEKPNLTPDWQNYDDVHSQCRKLKRVLKDLGFNKFDRNAYLYYFLGNSADWLNYNISAQKVQDESVNTKTLQKYRSKNFAQCLVTEDYNVMKAMGLSVNNDTDWGQMGDTSQKKAQFFAPLQAIERQLVAVLKQTQPAEMASQLYPLLSSVEQGEGTVLLQNRLGAFGLETLLQPQQAVVAPTVSTAGTSPEATASAPTPAPVIPGAGLIITAQQLAQVLSGLAISELSCARIIPEQLDKPSANTGILLFATQANSPRAKGGALEFEFSAGKINRIAFQAPSYRDFEQHVKDHPEVGECKIDTALLAKLHE